MKAKGARGPEQRGYRMSIHWVTGLAAERKRVVGVNTAHSTAASACSDIGALSRGQDCCCVSIAVPSAVPSCKGQKLPHRARSVK